MNWFFELWNGIVDLITNGLKSLVDYIKINKHKILARAAVLALCINPFLSVLFCYCYGLKKGLIMACLILIWAILVSVFEAWLRDIEKSDRKRLTRMNEYGDIEIDESDLHEALRLLYEIENEMGVR